MQRFEQRIAEGFLYCDCQFAIDPASEDFLRCGMYLFYRVLAYSRMVNLLARLSFGHRQPLQFHNRNALVVGQGSG